MIRMSMRDIDRIDRAQFLWIEPEASTALHQISYDIVREPSIDEDPYTIPCWIRYIDEELSMSEGCDDHRE
jgi:hypothetical protein